MMNFRQQFACSLGFLSAALLTVILLGQAAAGSADDPPPVFGGVFVSPAKLGIGGAYAASSTRETHRALVRAEAARVGLPPDIADAVAEVESGYHPDASGAAGEVGLMQVMPPTARMLGFAGSPAELAMPEVNVHYGVAYLAQAWRLAGGDICTATMKYRAGHGETRFSVKSVDYCLSVRAKLAARGYPVTGAVPVATFGDSEGIGGSAGSRRRLRMAVWRGPDLTSINKRLKLMTDAIVAHSALALR
jgi:hypothetical protein